VADRAVALRAVCDRLPRPGERRVRQAPDAGNAGLSDDVFGWGFGIFFFGYLLLEIPGALLVEHWSARKWFARILLTWGVCSMAMALVRTPGQFYLARFLLGVAEAGFFPGIIVYLTHWFPRADRGRAMAGLVFGVPVSLALGAKVSGWLLELNAFDLAGWQWVFLVEGLPAVLMGLAVPFLLTDRPAQAKWLTADDVRYGGATCTRGASLAILIVAPSRDGIHGYGFASRAGGHQASGAPGRGFCVPAKG
jgi:MFS family permease